MYQVPKKKRISRPEQDFQRALVKVLHAVLPKSVFFYAVPNGGYRKRAEAAILIGQGVVSGVPDLAFIHHGNAYFLELKSPVGKLSPVQRDCHARIAESGARVETVRTIDEALESLREFGIPLRTKEFERRCAA